MLRTISVNNFRSLKNFNLDINPGINVLVGPNGAGKTNIVKWFEFLSLLSNNSLRESVGKIGGANVVFRRGDHGRLEPVLDFSFRGNGSVARFNHEQGFQEDPIFINYRFSASINIIQTQIYFSRQHLQVWISPQPANFSTAHKPHLEIEWKAEGEIKESSVRFSFTRPRSKKFTHTQIFTDLEHESEWFRSFVTSRKHIFADNMILDELRYFIPIISSVLDDLKYGRAYNIIPSSVRSSQDISASSGVNFDGSGVAPTLYHLSAYSQFERDSLALDFFSPFKENYEPHLFRTIMDYFKISNEFFSNIEVDIDNFRNEFALKVAFDYESGRSVVPLSQLSDGNLKWLALVTAIATEKTAFFVEEPENFLHPKLQESAISILRSQTNSHPTESFAFVTTHSETLLNTLTPSEIILVSMHSGSTIASRLDDPRKITKVIEESGFGLGYFYVAGGF